MANYTWTPPLRGQFKVSVHTIQSSCQFNGNNIGIEIILRDHHGRLKKALTGTMRVLSPLATQLWALHLGLNHARLSNCEVVTLETNNFILYFEVIRKDGRGDNICLWIVEQIKKLLSHIPEWENVIHYILESSNRTAHNLSTVGLNN